MAKFVRIEESWVNIDHIDAVGLANVGTEEEPMQGTIIRLGMGTLTTPLPVGEVMALITDLYGTAYHKFVDTSNK